MTYDTVRSIRNACIRPGTIPLAGVRSSTFIFHTVICRSDGGQGLILLGSRVQVMVTQ